MNEPNMTKEGMQCAMCPKRYFEGVYHLVDKKHFCSKECFDKYVREKDAESKSTHISSPSKV